MQPEAKTPNSSGFNTQPPEGSWAVSEALPNAMTVSTHSRPKAAGIPPRANRTLRLFQHTAARRQLEMDEAGADKELLRVSTHSRPKAAGSLESCQVAGNYVSTHSRPKAAGVRCRPFQGRDTVSTHSRPKAAGGCCSKWKYSADVSTHSRPKAAGRLRCERYRYRRVSTHSRPKAAGQQSAWTLSTHTFQHTAARRRLGTFWHVTNCPRKFQHTAA